MQQQKRGFDPSRKESFNIAYFVMSAQATCVTPFTRTSFGSEALGFHALGALLLLCFWLMSTEAMELGNYLAFWFVVVVMQRIKTVIDGRRGKYQHSRYNGNPITSLLCSNQTIAKLMEGAFVIAGGMALEDTSLALSHLLMVSGGCIIILELIHYQYHNKQEEARRDAMIEMQSWANPV